MILIKCTNPNCPAQNGKFEWDEHPSLESDGRVAKKGDPEANWFVAYCTYCGTGNKIFLVKIKLEEIVRGCDDTSRKK